MPRVSPRDLLSAYPEIDFLVAEGRVSSSYMVSIHRAFYKFAAGQLSGGRVLDAGCGTGFGTSLLAERADLTIGIDLKNLLLLYGEQQYGREGLELLVMDAGHMGFPDETFDAVVADELVEHLPEHRPFLEEAQRVLKRGGLFICATVNRVHSFGTGDNPLNRNHFREYDDVDFREELARYFERVEILGQGFGREFDRYMKNRYARAIEWALVRLNVKHRIPSALRARVRSTITGVRADEAAADGFEVTDHDVRKSVYLVALAWKGKTS